MYAYYFLSVGSDGIWGPRLPFSPGWLVPAAWVRHEIKLDEPLGETTYSRCRQMRYQRPKLQALHLGLYDLFVQAHYRHRDPALEILVSSVVFESKGSLRRHPFEKNSKSKGFTAVQQGRSPGCRLKFRNADSEVSSRTATEQTEE